jgi:hypothetical protein
MECPKPRAGQARQRTPREGDRIEAVDHRLSFPRRGTIYYVDDLQILVKWDDGRSQSLRDGMSAGRFSILEDE